MRLSVALLALAVCACSAPKYTYYFDHVKDGQQASHVLTEDAPAPGLMAEERAIILDPNAISAGVQTAPVNTVVPEPVSVASVPTPVASYEPIATISKKEAKKQLKSLIRESKKEKAIAPENAAKAASASNDGFAIAGFALSLVSLFVLWPLAIPGIIFSVIGMKSNRRGLAIAGVIIGAVALILVLAAGAAIVG